MFLANQPTRLHVLLQRDHGIASDADTDPLDGHADELLDAQDVCLGVLGELVKGAGCTDVGLPAGQGFVHDLDLGEVAEVCCVPERKLETNTHK